MKKIITMLMLLVLLAACNQKVVVEEPSCINQTLEKYNLTYEEEGHLADLMREFLIGYTCKDEACQLKSLEDINKIPANNKTLSAFKNVLVCSKVGGYK